MSYSYRYRYLLRVKKSKSAAQFKLVEDRKGYFVELKTEAELKKEYGVTPFDPNHNIDLGTHFINTPSVDTPERDFFLLGKIQTVDFEFKWGSLNMFVYTGIYTVLTPCIIKRFLTEKEYNRVKQSKKIGEIT